MIVNAPKALEEHPENIGGKSKLKEKLNNQKKNKQGQAMVSFSITRKNAFKQRIKRCKKIGQQDTKRETINDKNYVSPLQLSAHFFFPSLAAQKEDITNFIP